MYRAQVTRLTAGDLEVRVPHWWLREVGLTLGEVAAGADGLRLPRLGRFLPLSWDAHRAVFRCGDLLYEGSGPRVDLETILRAPRSGWATTPWWSLPGAGAGRGAAPVGAAGGSASRGDTSPQGSTPVGGRRGAVARGRDGGRAAADAPRTAPGWRTAIWRDDRTPGALHLAAAALLSADEKEGLRVVGYLESVAAEEDAQRSELARIPLRRAVHHGCRRSVLPRFAA